MTLLTRMAQLFKADVHGILDSIEDPHSVLKQALRDMQEVLDEGEAELEILHRRISETNEQIKIQHQEIATLDEQLDLCFTSGDEDLARARLRQKLEQSKALLHTETTLRTWERDSTALAREIEQQRIDLQALRATLGTTCGTTATAPSAPTFTKGYDSITDDELDAAFLQEKQRRTPDLKGPNMHAKPAINGNCPSNGIEEVSQ